MIVIFKLQKFDWKSLENFAVHKVCVKEFLVKILEEGDWFKERNSESWF